MPEEVRGAAEVRVRVLHSRRRSSVPTGTMPTCVPSVLGPSVRGSGTDGFRRLSGHVAPRAAGFSRAGDLERQRRHKVGRGRELPLDLPETVQGLRGDDICAPRRHTLPLLRNLRLALPLCEVGAGPRGRCPSGPRRDARRHPRAAPSPDERSHCAGFAPTRLHRRRQESHHAFHLSGVDSPGVGPAHTVSHPTDDPALVAPRDDPVRDERVQPFSGLRRRHKGLGKWDICRARAGRLPTADSRITRTGPRVLGG